MTPAVMVRTVNADMTSYGGFVWPESGPVECPDRVEGGALVPAGGAS